MQPSPPPDPAYANQDPAYGPPPQAYPPQYVAPPQYLPSPWQGYPYQPPAPGPSMVTTIFAGVLAIMLGLYQGFQALVYLAMASVSTSIAADADFEDLAWLTSFIVAMGIGATLSAVALLVGAILLLVRKLFGRWLIAIGCVITILVVAVPVVLAQVFLTALSSQIDEDFSLFSGTGGAFAVFMIVLSVAVPLVTAVLAFLPSTSRYCRR